MPMMYESEGAFEGGEEFAVRFCRDACKLPEYLASAIDFRPGIFGEVTSNCF